VVCVPIKPLGRRVRLRLNESDLACVEKVFLQQEYDYPYPIVPKVIVDVGANIGMATLFFAAKYPDARIIALEPEKSNFCLMQENCSSLPNVTLVNAALWSECRQLQVADIGASKWAFSFVPSSGTGVDSVCGISMVDLLRDYDLKHIDILKMDVEGAERGIFTSDASRWLDKVGMIAIELHDRFFPGCARSFYQALQGHEFAQGVHGEVVFVDLTKSTHN